MPEPQSHETGKAKARQPRQPAPQATRAAPGLSPEMAGPVEPLELVLGNDTGQSAFQRHAALLGDSRLSQPAYARQRAALVQRLQHQYGNRYVQRLAQYIARQAAQRQGGGGSTGLGDLPFAELKKKLAAMSSAELGKLRQDKGFLDKAQAKLSNAEFGEVAAMLMLYAPDTVVQKKESITEALRLLSAQLRDKAVARTLVDKKVEVIIVPRNVPMTDLPQFKSLKGAKTFDGRDWTPVRGSGGMKVGDKIYVAIAEENLMGTDVDTAKVPGAGNYCKGYSTTTHEFAHTIFLYGLSDADRKKITDAYKKKKATEDSGKAVEWVDGPSKHATTGKKTACYASMNEHEYFAQVSNAWLGTNAGTDPFTGQKRHNGKSWVESNEPKEVVDILKRVYTSEGIKNANPRKK